MEKIIDKIVFPKSWKPYYVSELGEVFKGKGISKSEILDKGLPCIRYGEIYFKYDYKFDETYSFINQESANKSQEIKYGDVLFTGSGETAEEIGKAVAYVGNEKAYAGGDIIILRPNEPKAGLFYGYLMNSDYVVQQKFQEGQGQSVVHIYGKSMQRLRVVLPPLPEQQKIAAILSKWDELIETQTQLIEEKEKQKKGLMQKLLTGEVRFPGFEEEWEYKLLEDVLDYEQPTKYIVKSTSYSDNYSTPVLTAGKTFLLGYTNETNGVYKDCLPVIIFDDFTTANKFVDFQFKVKSSAMKILKAKSKEYHIYFIYEMIQILEFLPSDHKRYWISEYSQLEIPIPDIKEQLIISEFASRLKLEIQTLKDKLEAIKLQKKGLMQQLLTGRIRVKI